MSSVASVGTRSAGDDPSPESYDGVGTPIHGDVGDEDSLPAAMFGCDVAYYLVHSLDVDSSTPTHRARWGRDRRRRGRRRSHHLPGRLGDDDDDLSDHLQSRREVESLLGYAGVPITTLRAGIIIGHGGISWEMTRQIVEHLPAMIAPRWVSTKTQPIAADDVVRYLVGVVDHPDAKGRTFEIGGPEILTYADMLHRVAALEGRRRLIVAVPLLTPQLSSYWLALVTNVDGGDRPILIDSMTNEVIVTEHAIREIVPFEPMSFDRSVLAALGERAEVSRA